jgi:hypothetical protein
MESAFVEATQCAAGGFVNWGKFAVMRFTAEEWARPSGVGTAEAPLLAQVGWGGEHVLVLDLQTGEGAVMRPGGYARADLEKHRVWVCPMFEPFLEWLWAEARAGRDPLDLPAVVELPEAEFAMSGYRREGPAEADLAGAAAALRALAGGLEEALRRLDEGLDPGDPSRDLLAGLNPLLEAAREARRPLP